MGTWKQILTRTDLEAGEDTPTMTWGTGTGVLTGVGNFNGEVCKFGTAATSTATGHVMALVSGTWIEADKDTVAHGKALLGVATGSAVSSNHPTNGYLIKGMVRLQDSIAGTSPAAGQVVYLGTNGAGTVDATTSAGEIVRPIGYLVDVNTKTVFFDPDKTWVELV